MIVRISGEGQYRVDDETVAELDQLDNRTVQAVEADDQDELQRLLHEIVRGVKERGERLDDTELVASDVIVPPPDLTLEEAQSIFHGEGLIPDLPSQAG